MGENQDLDRRPLRQVTLLVLTLWSAAHPMPIGWPGLSHNGDSQLLLVLLIHAPS